MKYDNRQLMADLYTLLIITLALFLLRCCSQRFDERWAAPNAAEEMEPEYCTATRGEVHT